MEFSALEKSYIWLDSFPLGDAEKRKLLSSFDSAVDLVKNFSSLKSQFDEFSKPDLFEKMLKTLKSDSGYFSSISKALQEQGVTAIAIASELYPKEWKNVSDAPIVLYAKGDLNLLKLEKQMKKVLQDLFRSIMG